MLIDYVMYHNGCTDGLSSAWVIHQYLKLYKPLVSAKFISLVDFETETDIDNSIESNTVLYIGVNNNYNIGDKYITNANTISKLTNRNIVMVDISFSRDICNHISNISSSFLILDHHISNKRALEGLSYCIFDMTRAGCQITWDYYFGNKERSKFIEYIADRDLWKWELKDSKEYSKAVFIKYNLSFETFDLLNNLTDEDINNLIQDGKSFILMEEKIIKNICKFAKIRYLDGHKIMLVESTILKSDIGNYLVQKYPDCDGAAIYGYDLDSHKFWISLRGNNKNENPVDLSIIANKYNGGGHKSSSGFTYDGPNIENIFKLNNDE